jgi:fluoride exporter
MNPLSLVAVGVGAVVGAWLRWILGVFFNAVYPPIPLGTLAANLAGSLLMGFALVFIVERGMFPPEVRVGAITGLLGSFTTMSTFAAEAMTLMARSDYLAATGHVILHVAGSILMVFAGVLAARALIGS